MKKETELESGRFGIRCRGKEQAQAKNVPTKPRDSGTLGSALRPWSVAAAGKPLMELSQEHFPPPVSVLREPHPAGSTPAPHTPPGHPTSRGTARTCHIPHGALLVPYIPGQHPPHPAATPHIPREASWRSRIPGEAFRTPHIPERSRDTPHPTLGRTNRAPHIPGTLGSIRGTPHTGHPTSRGEPPGLPTSRPHSPHPAPLCPSVAAPARCDPRPGPTGGGATWKLRSAAAGRGAA